LFTEGTTCPWTSNWNTFFQKDQSP
jgi:hypothetical protein